MDSGLVAWLQVLVSFPMAMNSFGCVSSFALFQSHWQLTLSRSSLDIAWVGSLYFFLVYFLGTVSGPLMDAEHFRLITVIGTACQVVGVFATSGISQYWQLILAQGIVQGIRNGLIFTPCITLVSTYFAKRRGFAFAPTGRIGFPFVCESDFDTSLW
jgi:MFS family permease